MNDIRYVGFAELVNPADISLFKKSVMGKHSLAPMGTQISLQMFNTLYALLLLLLPRAQ